MLLTDQSAAGLQIDPLNKHGVAFHGAAPATQRASAAQAALGAATYAAPTAVPANSTEVTAPTTAEFNAALSALSSARTQLIALAADVAAHKTLINELRAALVEKGLIKGAA
jgi:hypothetical protein